MILILLIASILLGTTILTLSLFSAGWMLAGAVMVLTCLGWLMAVWRGWRWFAWFGLAVITLAAGSGILLDLPLTGMLMGLVCGLVAWDLDAFYNHLRFVEKDDFTQIVNSHMRRLGISLGLAAFLSIGSLILRMRLTFEWVALMVILGAWGASLMVRRLRKPAK